MKILKILIALCVLGVIGAVIYIALADIKVEQKEIVKEIPRDRFAHE
jgi:hypothetical protein